VRSIAGDAPFGGQVSSQPLGITGPSRFGPWRLFGISSFGDSLDGDSRPAYPGLSANGKISCARSIGASCMTRSRVESYVKPSQSHTAVRASEDQITADCVRRFASRTASISNSTMCCWIGMGSFLPVYLSEHQKITNNLMCMGGGHRGFASRWPTQHGHPCSLHWFDLA
jgi:hypothetical protein